MIARTIRLWAVPCYAWICWLACAAEPTITSQPRSIIASQDATVSFSVIADGDEPLSYQWLEAEVAIPDATNAVLEVTALTETFFSVVISNASGSVTSAPVFFEVNPALVPALDGVGLDWITRYETPWSAQSAVTHDGVDALRASSVPAGESSWLETTVAGPGAVSFWWKGPSLAGESLAFYVNDVLAAGAIGTTNWQFRTIYLGTGEQTLRWDFRRAGDGTGAPQAFLDQVNYTAGPSPPQVRAASGSQTIAITRTAQLFVEVDGTPPLRYQWYHDNQPMSEATNATLLIANVQFANEGLYRVTVSSDYGAASTTNWALTVVSVHAWGRNTFFQTNVTLSAINIVDVAAGWDHCLGLRANGTVVGWGRNAEGQRTIPQGLTNVIAISAGAYHSMALRNDGTVVAWGFNNRGQRSVPAGLQNVVAISAGGYHSAALKSDGTVVAWGWNELGQTNIPAGLRDVIAISAGGYHTIALKGDSTMVYWGAIDPVEGWVASTNLADVVGGLYNSTVLLQSGAAHSWGALMGMANARVDPVLFAVGNVYHRLGLQPDGRVIGWGDNALYGETSVPEDIRDPVALAASWSLSVIALGEQPPHLSAPPAGRSVFVDSNIGLLARATGTHPLRYQWEMNGASIQGATNAGLFLKHVQESASGDYRVIVTNAFGVVTSKVATVLVTIDPALALDNTNLAWFTSWRGQSSVTHDGVDALQSGPIGHGQSSVLLTSLTGPGAISFWWRVSSQTNADFLRFLGGTGAEASLSGESGWQHQIVYLGAGARTVRWTYSKDSGGSEGADAAWLDEVAFTPGGIEPAITLHPQDQSALGGNDVVFHSAAIGTPPLSYRWLFNESTVDVASNELTLTNVRRSQSGSYRVVVTNEFGSATSSPAVLRVRVPQQIVFADPPEEGLMFRDADGSAMSTNDLGAFKVQTSYNLIDWIEVNGEFIETNGALLFREPLGQTEPIRFYRIIEP
jgi:hypothetical protein